MDNNKNHNGNGFFAFLFGGIMGAAIGLLYAPKSGKETRQILLSEGDEMVNKAVSSIRIAQDKALTTIRDAQARVEALNDEAMTRLQKLQGIAKETLDEQKESVKKGYSKAKEAVTEKEPV